VTMKLVNNTVWVAANKLFINPTDQNTTRKEVILYAMDGSGKVYKDYILNPHSDTTAGFEPTIFWDSTYMYVAHSTLDKITSNQSLVMNIFPTHFYDEG